MCEEEKDKKDDEIERISTRDTEVCLNEDPENIIISKSKNHKKE